MKQKIIGLSLMVMLALSMTACGYNSKDEVVAEARVFDDPEDRVYVDESEFNNIFDCPDGYIGKYIKVIGSICDGPELGDNNCYFYQAWHDTETWQHNFAFRIDSKIDGLGKDDYVQVEGRITDDFHAARNFFGVLIEAETVTPLNYIEAKVPTLKEIEPKGVASTQNNITVQVNKVQYAETETRVFITMSNGSESTFHPDRDLTKLIQNDEEFEVSEEAMSGYLGGEYGLVPYELLSHTEEDAIIAFPPIDQNTNFQLHMEGSSVDEKAKFKPYDITIPVE